MTEGTKGGLDPSALAAALLAEAESFHPERGTIKAMLQTPEVFEAVKAMELRGMTIANIVEALRKHGVEGKPSTIKKRLQEVKREAKGGSNGKPERKSKATQARTPAEAGADSKATKQETGKQSSGATGSDNAGKPASGLAEAARNAKSSGGANKPDKHPEKGQPDMGGVYDEKNF